MFKSHSERTIIVQRTFRLAENIAPDIGNAVVPVWRCSRDGSETLVGTAFFAEQDGRSFLVTALHNFKNNPDVSLKIEFAGIIWALDEMSARTSSEDDLWAAETSADLHKHLRTIRVPLLCDTLEGCRGSTGSVLIGFPEDLNLQGKPFRALPISTTLETRELTTPNSLPEALVYNVHVDLLTTVEGSSVMDRPDMFGMSGGPVFGWFCIEVPGSSKVELHYFLQGVIVLWQRRDGYVVACNAARIATLLKCG